MEHPQPEWNRLPVGRGGTAGIIEPMDRLDMVVALEAVRGITQHEFQWPRQLAVQVSDIINPAGARCRLFGVA